MNRVYQSIILFCFLASPSLATVPYPTYVIRGNDGTVVARLEPDWDEALILVNSAGNPMVTFPIDQMLEKTDFIDDVQTTTAGTIWYKNAIAFTTSKDEFLIIRLCSEQLLVVDILNQQLMKSLPARFEREAATIVRDEALSLLQSSNPSDRETGAIVCGQLKIRRAVPNLRILLKDPSKYAKSGGGDNNWRNIYYVRKAAADALEAIDEDVGDIETEVFTGEFDPNRRPPRLNLEESLTTALKLLPWIFIPLALVFTLTVRRIVINHRQKKRAIEQESPADAGQ